MYGRGQCRAGSPVEADRSCRSLQDHAGVQHGCGDYVDRRSPSRRLDGRGRCRRPTPQAPPSSKAPPSRDRRSPARSDRLQFPRHYVRATFRNSPSAGEPTKRRARRRPRATAAEPSRSRCATAPTIASRFAKSRNEAARNSRPTRHPSCSGSERGAPRFSTTQGPLGSCTSTGAALGRLPLLPSGRLLRRRLLRRLLALDRHQHLLLAGSLPRLLGRLLRSLGLGRGAADTPT
jgi:hypothetical protein